MELKIKIRQIKWFGLLIRLPDNTASKNSLKIFDWRNGKTSSRQKTTCKKNGGKESKRLKLQQK